MRTLVLSLVLASACANDIDEKPSARVEEPAPAAPDGKKAAASLGTHTLDSAVSKLGWKAAKVTRAHNGGFKDFSGSAHAEGGVVSAATVTVSMESLFSDADRLTGHLLSDDFFDVERFAQATFQTTRIVEREADGATHDVTGVLSMHGQDNQITFPATIQHSPGAISVQAEFTIDRQNWGISYPGKRDDLIKDEVALAIDARFVPTS